MYFVKCIIKLEGVLYMIDCSVKKTSIMSNIVLMPRNIEIFIYRGLSQKESWGEVSDQQKYIYIYIFATMP